jgi:predicted metal-dependent peptidase
LFALTPVAVEGLGTFGVDRRWRLYVDPALFGSWDVAQVGSVLIHEVHHLVRDHAQRAEWAGVDAGETRRWNVAADFEINDDLLDLDLPDGGCFPSEHGFEDGELAETYFDELLRLGDNARLNHAECGSAVHGASRSWELHEADGPGVSDAEAGLIRQQVAQDVTNLAGRGAATGGLARWAKGYLNPVVNWRAEFRSLLLQGFGAVAGMADYSYSRPSRRQGRRTRPTVILPSMVRPVPRLAVVVDTSGSMSAGALEAGLAEVHGLLRDVVGSRQSITVLSCDAAVHSVQKVFAASALHLSGGGGTDMRVGLDAAWALGPNPQMVVVLTDGLTPWPDHLPPGRRVVVGLIGQYGHAPDWARSVRIPERLG